MDRQRRVFQKYTAGFCLEMPDGKTRVPSFECDNWFVGLHFVATAKSRCICLDLMLEHWVTWVTAFCFIPFRATEIRSCSYEAFGAACFHLVSHFLSLCEENSLTRLQYETLLLINAVQLCAYKNKSAHLCHRCFCVCPWYFPRACSLHTMVILLHMSYVMDRVAPVSADILFVHCVSLLAKRRHLLMAVPDFWLIVLCRLFVFGYVDLEQFFLSR